MQTLFYVIGVMSGTSLDGLDLALVEFKKVQEKWHYKFLETDTKTYSSSMRKRLSEARYLSKEDLFDFDIFYTNYLAEQIRNFISQNSKYDINLICSHGHTVFHQPKKGITLQIGNQEELAIQLKKTVVCNFRKQDVAFKGQGAPLVPGGEYYLFSEYKACVNIGGFANITLLQKLQLQAYDIAAANTILNIYAQQLKQPYDDRGKIAASGKLINPLLQQLEEIAYYKKKPPKSLGVEWVSAVIEPILNNFKHESVPDILHTYSTHLANQILSALPKKGKVLFTGGGSHNTFLMNLIRDKCSAEMCVPDPVLIDYKEAMIFGFLGVLKVLRINNCFASVTGASHNHSTGDILLQ